VKEKTFLPAPRLKGMDKHDRPCIKICRYDDDSGWCLGCGMTKQEKKAWKHVPAYRPVIRDALPARLGALAGQGYVTGPEAGKKKHKD
jgi:predicted Fe-S protein YdhL (DUF1289 family)